MKRAEKIYVAGPYTAVDDATQRRNVDSAISVAVAILQRGHFPFIPHLTHYVDEWVRKSQTKMSWEDYLAWDLVWLKECDALFYLGSSRGADLEKAVAEQMGKKIYRSLDEIPWGSGSEALDDLAINLLREATEI